MSGTRITSDVISTPFENGTNLGGTTDLIDTYPLGYANPTETGGAHHDLLLDRAGAFAAQLNGGHAVACVSSQDGHSSPIAVSSGGEIAETVACFARGTLIATSDGEVAVETITAGTRVALARGGSACVKWVGHRRLRPAVSRCPGSVQPIAIAPGALGDGLPKRELRLSPEHAIFVGGLLVPVGLLVNGQTIVRLNVDVIEYFHVELKGHDVILAEGAPAETYLDTGNRSIFANAPLVDLHPHFERGGPCAEMMFDGAWLHALRARLAGAPQDKRATA